MNQTVVLLFSTGLLLGALPLACDPAESVEPVEGSGGEPAMQVETPAEGGSTSACGPLAIDGCDASCDTAHPCAAGLYCRQGLCGADCNGTTGCGSDEVCQVDGRCLPMSNIKLDPLKTDPNKPAETGPTCVEGEVEFEAVVPQVWLLLDRSGSMSSSLSDVSRWEALGTVLLGAPDDPADRGVVGEFADRVAFGATFYTSGSSTAYGCVLDLETVAVARNSYTSIRHRYQQLAPSGGTPTAESIAAVVSNAKRTDLSGGPKILVLATDGSPSACSIENADAMTSVENEVAAAFSEDIRTFAISISTGTSPTHMQRVANLGVGLAADAEPPAPFYTAESQDELKLAFSTILEDVPRSCVFSLNGEVDPDNADQGTVILAGATLEFEDADGWKLAQVDQVELQGAACEAIRAGEEDLDISFPCSVFTPIVK